MAGRVRAGAGAPGRGLPGRAGRLDGPVAVTVPAQGARQAHRSRVKPRRPERLRQGGQVKAAVPAYPGHPPIVRRAGKPPAPGPLARSRPATAPALCRARPQPRATCPGAKASHDAGSIRRVPPRPVATASAAARKTSPISAAASCASARADRLRRAAPALAQPRGQRRPPANGRPQLPRLSEVPGRHDAVLVQGLRRCGAPLGIKPRQAQSRPAWRPQPRRADGVRSGCGETSSAPAGMPTSTCHPVAGLRVTIPFRRHPARRQETGQRASVSAQLAGGIEGSIDT